MSGISSFNAMLEQFITELQECFPNEKKIRVYANSFDIMKKNNPKKCMSTFMNAVHPYKDRIKAQDDSLMQDDEVTLVNGLNLSSIWKSDECTNNTKEAIWAHLNTLIIFGETLEVIPSGLMNGIEKLASEYAAQMDDGKLNSIDSSMLLKNMQMMMKHK
jgi:hypothetical protein